MNSFPFIEYLLPLIFLAFVGATIGGALLAVLTQWIIRSVCGLAMASVGLAGMFYFLNSPFLAMIHILIYIGAVCITIVFAIMLAEPDEPDAQEQASSLPWTLGAGVVAGALFLGLAWLGLTADWPTPVVTGDGSVESIGIALLTTQSLALEIIAVVLLVSILGALAIARRGRHKA
ncbi:MAG: NADH-quinone oxidoreductase subunit J [Opitutales bacterium]|nr:NADH-quinone oxidoreductase subunit J [Opitutales bacterium]